MGTELSGSVAELLAQHTALLQRLTAVAIVGRPKEPPETLRTPEERRKWRNRKNRYRKKIRRIFKDSRNPSESVLRKILKKKPTLKDSDTTG